MAYGDGAGPDAGGEWDGEWDLDPHGERGGYEDDGGPPTSWMPRSQERPRRRGGRRGIVLILLGMAAVAVAALAVVVPKMMSSTENVHLSSGSATASRAAATSAATSPPRPPCPARGRRRCGRGGPVGAPVGPSPAAHAPGDGAAGAVRWRLYGHRHRYRAHPGFGARGDAVRACPRAPGGPLAAAAHGAPSRYLCHRRRWEAGSGS